MDWQFLQGDTIYVPYDDNHFDLVFCSPPYEAQRQYGEVEFDVYGEEWIAWAVPRFLEHLRVCKGLVAWVVEGATTDFSYSAMPFLLMAKLKQLGVTLRKPCVYKRHGIPGTGSTDWLRNDWEPIICATKGGALPWSDNTAMGTAPKYNTPRTATNRQRDGTRKQQEYVDPEKVNPGNVISGTVGMGQMGWKDCHLNEAPFPEWLANFFVRTFCPPGGIVFDGFSGSGTTVAAAVAAGRNGVGMDLRDNQVYLAETRLMGLRMAERKAGQLQLFPEK